MEAFKALSSEERWRVRRAVFRGEAPSDPRMTAAAIELAESYQEHGRRERWLYWTFAVAGVGSIIALILSAVDGDLLHAAIFALLTLTSIVHLTLNPATRPKSVARSLEASRAVVAQAS